MKYVTIVRLKIMVALEVAYMLLIFMTKTAPSTAGRDTYYALLRAPLTSFVSEVLSSILAVEESGESAVYASVNNINKPRSYVVSTADAPRIFIII